MRSETVLFYTPSITSRIRYIASHLISEILGARLQFTNNFDEACSSELPLINYSDTTVKKALNIYAEGLLTETGIRKEKPVPDYLEGLTVFYPSVSDDFGFDIFSSSFFMLSRYEEYMQYRKDIHGRFPYNESLACRYSLEEEPLVDLWAEKLQVALKRMFPAVYFPEREFTFIPTIDADIPWAYRNRGVWRTAGGLARSILKGDIQKIRSRCNVIFGEEPDPFDTFGFMEELHRHYDASPLFFFPAGTYGKYDKCISCENPGYRRLIKDLSGKYRWGIHPSYRSFGNVKLLRKEAGILKDITGDAPARSRSHFLRFEFPETGRMLERIGIIEDYTIGWAELPGFRAGTCTPFLFYDIGEERISSLRLFPFQLMDGTLCDYMKLSAAEAAEESMKIITKVQNARGTLITLWHNESFSESGRWKNWRNVYNEVINAATQ